MPASGPFRGTGHLVTTDTSVRSKPLTDIERSRRAAQETVMWESIHQMITRMKDPEVSGLIALMKADEESGKVRIKDAVSAYRDTGPEAE